MYTSGNSERMKSGDLSGNFRKSNEAVFAGKLRPMISAAVAPEWLILSRNSQKSKTDDTSHNLNFLLQLPLGNELQLLARVSLIGTKGMRGPRT